VACTSLQDSFTFRNKADQTTKTANDNVDFGRF
jgi:hypothetical protein